MSPVRRFVRPGRVGVWTVRRVPNEWGHLLPWLAYRPGTDRHPLDGTRFATMEEALAAVARLGQLTQHCERPHDVGARPGLAHDLVIGGAA
jgi:hypothetical protein